MCPCESALWREALAAILVPSRHTVPSLSSLRLGGHLQHLHKEACEFVNEAPAKGGQRVVVGVAACGNVAKGHGVVGGHFQLAAGEDARAVAVHQDGQQGRRVVGLGAATGVLACQPGEVQAIDDFNDKARQVVLGEPIVHRRGQQVVGFAVGGNEVGHGQNHQLGQVKW